ncbi:hypothetical protein RJ640_008751 [Escallonia rubra]|uniref:Uncharacterized protein n=1 Tax=Escallonia rubra TaxID=112253 RepID=A0AA88QNG1_9ASTE|nr:hypothetical protein RJ640_008751 [Escallonia rubra]
MAFNQVGMIPIFRSEMGYTDMEKRQLFLRSYQFSRKKSVGERIRRSFFRVKRVIWVRLRSARKLRKMIWFRLRNGLFYSTRRRMFLRLHNNSSTSYRSKGINVVYEGLGVFVRKVWLGLNFGLDPCVYNMMPNSQYYNEDCFDTTGLILAHTSRFEHRPRYKLPFSATDLTSRYAFLFMDGYHSPR